MVLKVLLKFPPTLVLVHGWFFPGIFEVKRRQPTRPRMCKFVGDCDRTYMSGVTKLAAECKPFTAYATLQGESGACLLASLGQ